MDTTKIDAILKFHKLNGVWRWPSSKNLFLPVAVLFVDLLSSMNTPILIQKKTTDLLL